MAGLASGVEGSRDLRSAERTVVEEPAVLSGEGNAEGHAVIDDGNADLGKPMDVCFPRSEVAALDGVVEQTVHGVAVVLVIFGRVDTSLRGNRVGAPWGILVAKGLHLVAEFSEGCGCGCAGETSANDDNLKLAAIGRVDELGFELVILPLLFERPRGYPGIEGDAHCLRDAWKG